MCPVPSVKVRLDTGRAGNRLRSGTPETVRHFTGKRELMATHSSRLFLAVLLTLGWSTSAALGQMVFPDPEGDTVGVGTVQHDINSISATLSAPNLIFSVSFAGPILAPSATDAQSVVGFLDLDTDQDSMTGRTSGDADLVMARGVPAKSGLGVEFFLDLFSELLHPGSVDVVDATTLLPTGAAPIAFGASSFAVSVPLALVGGDNGLVHYGVIVGTFLEPTDEARDAGLSPAFSTEEPGGSIVPEPSAQVLAGIGALGLFGLCSWHRRQQAHARRRTST